MHAHTQGAPGTRVFAAGPHRRAQGSYGRVFLLAAAYGLFAGFILLSTVSVAAKAVGLSGAPRPYARACWQFYPYAHTHLYPPCAHLTCTHHLQSLDVKMAISYINKSFADQVSERLSVCMWMGTYCVDTCVKCEIQLPWPTLTWQPLNGQ